MCFVETEVPDDSLLLYGIKDHHINSDLFEISLETPENRSKEDFTDFLHRRLHARYAASPKSYPVTRATDLSLRLGEGALIIPGWLRHACTDVFFDSSGDIDTPSLPEMVLDCLLNVSNHSCHDQ